MPFMYSANRQKVELTLSADDIGVRFESPEVARTAVRATRGGTAPRSRTVELHETSPRAYGRTVLLHQAGAARASFATVRDALPRRLMTNVQRTLPVYVEQQSGLRLITTPEITVRFKPQIETGQRMQLLMSMNLEIRRTNEFNPAQYVVASTSVANEAITLDLANTLSEQESLVEYAAPNFISEHRKLAVRDPLLALQWHLNNRGRDHAVEGEDVDALRAWEIADGGSPNIIIAIVDDGVDIEHPDLQENIWMNPDTDAPDRNGRNFYDGDFNPRPQYFRRPFDQLEGNDIHGTPCAGVAAAASNRRGGVGIAYRSKILPVKIFGADFLAPNDQVADAIRYAGRHAQVISCSWSSPQNPDLESALSDVSKNGRDGKGCLVFCATGNEGEPRIGFPARYPTVFAIGASNDQGRLCVYSNFGEGIDFVAPSNDPDAGRPGITTTDLARRNRGFNLRRAYTNDFGGTSSATPLAAGIAALVLSVNPDLTRVQVRNILRATAEKIDADRGNYRDGYSLRYGYGRLNAYEAVKQAQSKRSRKQNK